MIIFTIVCNILWIAVNYIIKSRLSIFNNYATDRFSDLEKVKDSCITSSAYYFYINFCLYHTRLYDLHHYFWLLTQSLFFMVFFYFLLGL